MRKALLLSAVLLAGTLLAADKSTFEGTVSDAMCGAKHGMAGMSDRDCTLGCVKKGSKFALVVNDKVYTLEGKTKGLEQFAGGKAKVTGTLKGETINVSSVAAAN
jgi:hypothetical protein